ncbi:MAG: hypothetical protein IT169_12420 [Bryobacterales bacterium]|nr:hypothetical protein [Bryobacterales bacterium]
MRLRFHSPRWVCAACLLTVALSAVRTAPAQSFIDEVRVRMLEPASGKVRPLEEAILKVEIYGTQRSKDGSEQKGLLPLDAAYLVFAENNSGWVSKAYQCPDFNQRDYIRERTGGWRDILGTVQNFTLKSCYLYTAPAKPGRYRLQASKDGMAGEITLNVEADAASTRTPEVYTFPDEPRSTDPYFPLVEHYAPFIAQETWFTVKADSLSRFDYDGDFHGDNNWDNLGKGSSQAYVYYAVMETGTHWFLHYNFFHPRDYSDVCALGTCHENDNEGLILAVRKDGTAFGKLEAMESLAHNLLFSYVADERIGERAQNLDGALVLYEGSHPMIFIEAGGHGVAGAADGKLSLYDSVVQRWLPGSTGITYVYKGKAERPMHAGAEKVGYALLPIYEHWWLRAIDGSGRAERMFADYYTYAPLGDRPLTPVNPIPAAFLGVAKAANKARPFWGWFDDRTLKQGILAQGQWALDPAYSFTRNLHFPDELPVSLDYTFNLYLGIGAVADARKSESNPVKGDASAPAPAAPGWGSPAPPPPSDSGPAPSLEGWGQPTEKPAQKAPDGWGDPPATAKPQQAPEGWGTPEKPKQKAPEGW